MTAKILRKKDRALLDEIKKRPCILCGQLSDPAHIKTRGSGGDDVETNLLSLCRRHHTEQGALGWHTFITRHPCLEGALRQLGWEIVNEFGVMKLRRLA